MIKYSCRLPLVCVMNNASPTPSLRVCYSADQSSMGSHSPISSILHVPINAFVIVLVRHSLTHNGGFFLTITINQIFISTLSELFLRGVPVSLEIKVINTTEENTWLSRLQRIQRRTNKHCWRASQNMFGDKLVSTKPTSPIIFVWGILQWFPSRNVSNEFECLFK